MPVMSCTVGEKSGYKYGESGHCYTYTANDEPGRKNAKRKAITQNLKFKYIILSIELHLSCLVYS